MSFGVEDESPDYAMAARGRPSSAVVFPAQELLSSALAFLIQLTIKPIQ